MTEQYSNVWRKILGGAACVALMTFVAAGSINAAARNHHDLEHYAKVGVKDSAKDTKIAVEDTGRETGHIAAETGKTSERLMRRIGRAVY